MVSRAMQKVASLRALLDGEAPVIAMSFGDRDIDAEVKRAHQRGLDVAELRIDTYISSDADYVVEQAQKFSSLPSIATIRTEREGGYWTGPDEERLHLFEKLIPEVHGIDIELSSAAILSRVVARAKAHKKVVIISHHDFEETPSADELGRMAHQAKELGADFVKISAMASSAEDLRRLAEFTIKESALGLIVIGMGGHGSASRVLFPLLGSRLTYASSSLQTVSGQLPFEETFSLLRQFSPDFNGKKIIELGIIMDGS
jgi:3-dehydroquinate dehydratase I